MNLSLDMKKGYKSISCFFDGMINKDFVNENILFKANSTYQNTNSIKCENASDFLRILLYQTIL